MAKQNFSHRANVICDRSFPGIRKCSRSSRTTKRGSPYLRKTLFNIMTVHLGRRARLKELGSHRLPSNILQMLNPSLCEVFFLIII